LKTRKIWSQLLCALALISGCASHIDKQSGFSQEEIKQSVDSAASWQLMHMDNFADYLPYFVHRTEEPLGWVQGTFYLGLAKWAKQTNNQAYHDYLVEHGTENKWKLAPRLYHADDHVIAQSYLALYKEDQVEQYIQPLLADFDKILANAPTSSMSMTAKNAGAGLTHCLCRLRYGFGCRP